MRSLDTELLAGSGAPAGMTVETREFDDAQAHAESLHAWKQDYQQISAGAFRSRLFRLSFDGVALFREQANQRISEQGVSPGGDVVSFGLLVKTEGPAWFQGRPVGPSDLLCMPGATDFRLHLPAGTDVVGLTLPCALLDAVVPEDARDPLRRRLARHLVRLPTSRHDRLRANADRLMRGLSADTSSSWSPATRKLAAHRLLAVFVSPLLDELLEPEFDLTQAVRCDIVERCRELALHPSEEPVTMLDLCAALRLSRRTLQNSFLSVTGTSPACYLRSLRMAQVRRDLQRTAPEELSIRDAAARWGFTDIHFAAAYQRQFGERPSATRRRQ